MSEPGQDEPVSEPGGVEPTAGPHGSATLRLRELAADVPSALRVGAVVVLVGLPLGAMWALLAPGVGTVALGGGASGSLPGETDHAFDAIAVFVLLSVAYGVVVAAVAWRRRATRGPVMLVGVVVATLIGAWLAGRIGIWLAPASSPVPVLVDHAAISRAGDSGPPLPGMLSNAARSPGPWWAAVVGGLAAALTYLIAAIADGHEDPRERTVS